MFGRFKIVISGDTKSGLIAKYRTHENDTGSPEVQVALLTERINDLQDHFRDHDPPSMWMRGRGKDIKCLIGSMPNP